MSKDNPGWKVNQEVFRVNSCTKLHRDLHRVGTTQLGQPTSLLGCSHGDKELKKNKLKEHLLKHTE